MKHLLSIMETSVSLPNSEHNTISQYIQFFVENFVESLRDLQSSPESDFVENINEDYLEPKKYEQKT